MNVAFSREAAWRLADRIERRWGKGFVSVEAGPGRVRGLLHELFHFEVTGVDPLQVRLTGWDRDLTDLIPGGVIADGGIEDVMTGIDATVLAVLRDSEIPRSPRPQRASPSIGWSARRADALWARRRQESGETVVTAMTPEETSAVFQEVWPDVEVRRRDDDFGRVSLEARPYGGNRVSIGMSRRGTLVVPVADGEGVSFPSGRSTITDGLHGQVLSALEAADEWLRTTAPTDEVLARPVIR